MVASVGYEARFPAFRTPEGAAISGVSTNGGEPTRKRPEEVTLSREEGEALIARLEREAFPAEERRVLVKVLTFHFWLLFALREAKLSLKRLKTLVFGEKPKRRELPDSHGSGGSGRYPSGISPAPTPGGAATQEQGEAAATARRPGPGHQSAAVYQEAQRVEGRQVVGAVGERCPACGRGRLYQLPPGIEMRLDGHALLSAVRYEMEKLRCSACGQGFTAALPAAAGTEKYSARARAVIALGRYYLGVPLYRLEGYQAMVGVPVPDATQWDLIEHVGNCAFPGFKYLERQAAQSEVIDQDDTAARVLALIAENRQPEAPERTGMYTTGLLAEVAGRRICLSYAGPPACGRESGRALAQARTPAGQALGDVRRPGEQRRRGTAAHPLSLSGARAAEVPRP